MKNLNIPVKPNDGDLVLGGNKKNQTPQLRIHNHKDVQQEKDPRGNVYQEQVLLPQGQIAFLQGNLQVYQGQPPNPQNQMQGSGGNILLDKIAISNGQVQIPRVKCHSSGSYTNSPREG